MFRARACCLFILAAAPLVACGPIETDRALSRAYIAIEGARGADAQRYAVYEYQSALLYLQKAREEEGHSNFEGARHFAKESRSFADKARARALTRRRARPRSLAEQRRNGEAEMPARAIDSAATPSLDRSRAPGSRRAPMPSRTPSAPPPPPAYP